MKKRVFTALVSILMIFVIAGCSNSSNSNQSATNGNGNGNKGGFQKPDVYGEVASISGNNVTLKLMKIPQMNRGNGNYRGSGNGNMSTNGGAPGNTPSNNPGNANMNRNGGQGPGQGQGRGGMRAKAYTGEQKTITIPNGVQMTTMTRGANGATQSNVSLSDITTGSTLSIYYDTDGKTIKSIRVQKPWAGNGQGSNGTGNGTSNGTGNGTGNVQTGNTAS